MKNIILIEKICRECVEEGQSLLNSKWIDDQMGEDFFVINPRSYVDLEGFRKWKSNCNVLLNLLGELSNPWNESFLTAKNNSYANAVSMLGALRSMKDTIDKGYLTSIEDLVFELYKAKYYDKIEFKNVEHLIAIGNNAAHNQPFKQDEIKKLIARVKEI